MLDEPTAGQDYGHYKRIYVILLETWLKREYPFYFHKHTIWNLALEYADRAVVLPWENHCG